MQVIVTLPFVRIRCILVTDGRMVEFNSSICQERHEDTGQMEDHLKPLSHLSHTPIYERNPKPQNPVGANKYVCLICVIILNFNKRIKIITDQNG